MPVALAYLEAMTPSLGEAVDALADQGATSIAVFPLFMAQGGHLKQDVPRLLDAIRARKPDVPIALQAAIGDVPELLDAIAGWVVDRAGADAGDSLDLARYFFPQMEKPSFHPDLVLRVARERLASLRA